MSILTFKNYHVKKSSQRGSAEMNTTRNHEVVGSIAGRLAQWVKDPVPP